MITKFQVIAGITICCQIFGKHTNLIVQMKSLVTKNSSNTILLFDREITDIVIIKSSMKVTVNDEKNHACSEKKNLQAF